MMTCQDKGDMAGDVAPPDILEIALRSDWPVGLPEDYGGLQPTRDADSGTNL